VGSDKVQEEWRETATRQQLAPWKDFSTEKPQNSCAVEDCRKNKGIRRRHESSRGGEEKGGEYYEKKKKGEERDRMLHLEDKTKAIEGGDDTYTGPRILKRGFKGENEGQKGAYPWEKKSRGARSTGRTDRWVAWIH